jgi:pilus assembly protein FimV
MSVTLPRLMLMACLLSPSLSWALGLGEIHLNSALNEPLNAEIDILAAAPDELTALRAALASREAFTRYGIDRPPFLQTISFKVGKSAKNGRDVLQVRSSDAIPEPFVTFLVDVNWARGHLMREYTVLLDPPVYTPGDRSNANAPVTAPSVAPSTTSAAPAPQPSSSTNNGSQPYSGTPARASRGGISGGGRSAVNPAGFTGSTYTVSSGDTLSKIVHSLKTGSNPADIDQTMIAVYRANPDAFGGNINILKRGAVLRVPGADDIAALNQNEAANEVRRQMDSWKGGEGAPSSGHLRLVTPGAGTGTAPGGAPAAQANAAETQALQSRVNDLQTKLADANRLLEIRNNELAALQKKLGTAQAPPPAAPVPPPPVAHTPPPPAATPPAAVPPAATPPAAVSPPAATPPTATAPPPAAAPPETSTPTPLPPPAAVKKPAAPAAGSESWIDWIAANWWLPAAVIVALFVGLAFAAWRRRQAAENDFPGLDSTDIASYREPGRTAGRGRDDAFLVEESGEHPAPQIEAAEHFGETTSDLSKAADDTMSSESAVNLDQGDPLAEADFHMAYGLYDQAADLVRIALEREPERRDLRMKLLEIYFVWGNKDQFLQTAKSLETTRDRAPAGEWDKIVIMGKQICPDEPMFQSSTGGGRGAGDVVDLNLEGGENRVDIDLFGEPEEEHKVEDLASSGESPHLHASDNLDFHLDSPERGADDSPTREMPPRDEPTVESELMNFTDTSTGESPALKGDGLHDRISSKLPSPKIDQTAEVSIDDLGLDLDHLEDSSPPSHERLAVTDHPSDAPTMVAGLDEKSRRLMADAENRAREKDMTELERELEASFVADLGPDMDQGRTAVLGPESAPTVQMPRANDPTVQMPRGSEIDAAATSRFKTPDLSDIQDLDKFDAESTSRLRSLSPSESIDLDLDKLANALGSGDTVDQPRAEDEIFSSEVFEASARSRGVDLDVGESFEDSMSGSESPTNKMHAITSRSKAVADDAPMPELEPVTMSEVGTKLDLARAYMDMGDPEGARSILEEVVSEGSASQKQEAQRLIEALPG